MNDSDEKKVQHDSDFDVENASNKDVMQALRRHLMHDDTDKFNHLLKRVCDLIDSQTTTGLFGKTKSKNKSKTNYHEPLNLKKIFRESVPVASEKSDPLIFKRLVACAIYIGNIDAATTLITVHNDDVNFVEKKNEVMKENSLLAIAVHRKPKIVAKHGKKKFLQFLTMLLEKGCKLAFNFETKSTISSHLLKEDILLPLMYQTKLQNKNGVEQYEEMNIDLAKFFIDAHSNKRYKFSYDWKKWDKIGLNYKAYNCITSGNLEMFKFLLNVENAFGMKKLSWNKSVRNDTKNLFQCLLRQIGRYDLELDRDSIIEFWDILSNKILGDKKEMINDIFDTRTILDQTTAHRILQRASKWPPLVDRLMKLGFDPNDEEYRCYIIRYVAPCVEAMKMVMNENGQYKHAFDLVCLV